MLESYGPAAFAAALAGDADTPELVWTHAMRMQRLVPQARALSFLPPCRVFLPALLRPCAHLLRVAPASSAGCCAAPRGGTPRAHAGPCSPTHSPTQMLRHLGDFPRRLGQYSHARYEYTPCPPVGYPEVEVGGAGHALLCPAGAGFGAKGPCICKPSSHSPPRCPPRTARAQGEVWCHRYCLRNLCDEGRFPGWVIEDHVPFLQARAAGPAPPPPCSGAAAACCCCCACQRNSSCGGMGRGGQGPGGGDSADLAR